MTETRYGNDNYWCFFDEKWSGKEVAIWEGPEGQEQIIGRARDKYIAKTMIDALLKHVNTDVGLSNKQQAFLEFVTHQCVEPYATMASNAILWKDKVAYEDLKNKFSQIYA